MTDKDNVELLLARVIEYKTATLNQELHPSTHGKNKRTDAARALDTVEKTLKKKGYNPDNWIGKKDEPGKLF